MDNIQNPDSVWLPKMQGWRGEKDQLFAEITHHCTLAMEIKEACWFVVLMALQEIVS